MRRAVLAAAAAALAVGLTGCGIPDETEVRDIGAGPSPGVTAGGTRGQPPPTRESATTVENFVANFLAAAAGDPKKEKPIDRVRHYVIKRAEGEVKEEDGGINVVRPRGEPTITELSTGKFEVKLKVDQVGLLSPEGWIGPAALDEQDYTFEVGSAEGQNGWFVTKPPPNVLLSTEALHLYYTQRTIYFWSADRTTLVPDNRYMPGELDEGQQPTEIVRWLTTNPSPWIRPVVSPLNEDTKSNQNVPYPSDKLEVGLNAEAAEPPTTVAGNIDILDQLGKQLMWSLRPYLRKSLELRVDGQSPRTFTPDDAFYAVNPAHRLAGKPGEDAPPPQRFALYNGKIYRLKGAQSSGMEPLPQLLLEQGVNEGLASAALAQETTETGVQTAAALVVRQGQQFRLRVSDGSRPFTTSGSYAQVGRPVLLKAPLDAGLVVINDQLYQFSLDRGVPEQLSVPGLTKITYVSAAPDGRRVALIAHDKVYVVALSRSNQQIEVSEPRLVPTKAQKPTALDWSEEAQLVVAGTVDGQPAVWATSPDGAMEKSHTADVEGTIAHLVAYPADPVAPGTVRFVMYDRNGAAYDQAGDSSQIEAGEVVGVQGEFDPARVSAPFFMLD